MWVRHIEKDTRWSLDKESEPKNVKYLRSPRHQYAKVGCGLGQLKFKCSLLAQKIDL